MRSCGASTHWGTSPVKIRIANSAGFCYGVRRAVELAEGAARSGEPCVMLGPIIHNQDMMDHLARHGLRAVVRPEEVPEGSEVIIRSHGESRAVHEGLHAGASASWTPPVPMSSGSTTSWPGRRSREGSPSSSGPGPPGGGGHRRMVQPPGGPVWSGGAGKLAGGGPVPTPNATHFCVPDHGHPQGLGFLREKSKKRVYKPRIF